MNEPSPGAQKVAEAWRAARTPFSAWVRDVATAVDETKLKTHYVAEHLGITVATLEGVLQLSFLEDEALARLDEAVPPTAYLLIAQCSSEEVEEVIAVLREPSIEGLAPSERVHAVLRESRGAPASELVSSLRADLFSHFAKKAKDYDLLTERKRDALVSFGRWRRKGSPLTIRQATWAAGMLSELRDRGAIRRDSPDGDQELCDEVLDAIGD
jgi:hypothetical protein